MVATKLMTADELLALGDNARVELIEGEPFVMSPTGVLHMAVVSRLTRLLTLHSLEVSSFDVFGHDGGFLLRNDPDTVVAPDIAILTREQLQSIDLDSDAYCPVAPAIAIEVKSPSDRESDIARKLAVYLGAGVREVWWIRPLERQMSVHWPKRAPEIFGIDQTFSGSVVLPGLSFRLSELLETRNPAAE